jgi:hypothetical protein
MKKIKQKVSPKEPPIKQRSKIYKIYQLFLERLPATYPKPELVIYPSFIKLHESYMQGIEDDEPPYAFCDSEDNTVHVPKAINLEDLEDMIWYMAHEVGHLYALEKYGKRDSRWSNNDMAEKYANDFATRWVSRLRKEKWFKNIC